MQKVNRIYFSNVFLCSISVSFSPWYAQNFSPFLHSTFLYRSRKIYLIFDGGPPIFEQSSTCFILLILFFYLISHRAITPSMALFYIRFFITNKRILGLICFRSPLLTESLLIFFPLVTKMFQFTKFFFFLVFFWGYLWIKKKYSS